jgi:hypothetical protein
VYDGQHKMEMSTSRERWVGSNARAFPSQKL